MLKQKRNKFILGITGNIGSGKSTIAEMFKSKDSLLIDADILAHQLFFKGSSVYKKIIATFGKKVLKAGSLIDRKTLGKIVFSNKNALIKLNSIVHPAVIKEIKRRIKDTRKKVIILDAPLIIEAGLKNIVDKLIAIKAKKSQQILRSQKKSGLSRQDIIKRMKFQISPDEKSRFADFIIDNSGSIVKTKKQVKQIRGTLARLCSQGFSRIKSKEEVWKS